MATRSDWTTPANADGAANSTLASFAGNAVGARAGGIRMPIAAPTGKTALTITSVKARFWMRQAGTLAGNGTLTVGYRSSAGVDTTLATYTADLAALTTPVDFDLTAVIGGDWAQFATKLAALWATCSTAVANTSTADVDAVALVVSATLTDLI